MPADGNEPRPTDRERELEAVADWLAEIACRLTERLGAAESELETANRELARLRAERMDR